MTAVRNGAQGPLTGVRLVEFGGIGPAPFAVMLLADLGAEVVRIARAHTDWPDLPIVSRGRATLNLDLKSATDLAYARRIAAAADVVIEGFRPGVMERIGLGPDDLLGVNPRLVYGRMTGWGQGGDLAHQAGHDINYIGLSGLLGALTGSGALPVAPLNVLGDYGGGGLYLALGVVAALYECGHSGKGQVIDAAIVDGSASLLAPVLGMIAAGLMPESAADGMLGGNYPFYRAYVCADGRHLAVGALEPRFRARVASVVGLAPEELDDPAGADRVEAIFATRTRDDWLAEFAELDCCVSPILDLEEAKANPHLVARGTYFEKDAITQPAPAPRFSRTPGAVKSDGDAGERLAAWGVAERESEA